MILFKQKKDQQIEEGLVDNNYQEQKIKEK